MEINREVATPPTEESPAQPRVEHNGTGSHGAVNMEHKPVRIGCVLVMFALLIAAAAAAVIYFRSTRPAPGEANARASAKAKTVPVSVAKAIEKTVPVEIQVVGSVLPYQTVAVSSQVTGQILQVFFRQGEFVNANQKLFQIDPRPLQAALDQANANILRDKAQVRQAQLTVDKDAALVNQAISNINKDKAQLEYALSEDKRYSTLLRQGYVTSEQAEQQHANAMTYVATVKADQATLDSVKANMDADTANVKILQANLAADEAVARNAQVQLGYTSINAPLEGRTGAFNLYPGAVVQANSNTPLVTIDQVRPSYVTFAVPEQYLSEIRRLQVHNELPVQAVLADQGGPPEDGKVTFVDQAVDTTTGTIALRGTFPNHDLRLWPGHYVNVTLLLGDQKNALLVPEQSVNPGQNGDYVFVVLPNMTVDKRDVQIDRSIGGFSVVKSGINVGDTVVTDGQLQLIPGVTVSILKASAGKNGSHHRGGAPGVESPAPEPPSANGESPAAAGASPAAVPAIPSAPSLHASPAVPSAPSMQASPGTAPPSGARGPMPTPNHPMTFPTLQSAPTVNGVQSTNTEMPTGGRRRHHH